MKKRLNASIYETCADKALPFPTIPVYEREYFGQCAEDLIVVSFLRAFAKRTGADLTKERYLEIGANHPISTNSSYLPHIGLGMTGVLVEANANLLDDLQRHRPHDIIVHAAVTKDDVEKIAFYISNHHEISSLSKTFVENWQDGQIGVAEVTTVPARRINGLMEEFFSHKAPLFLSIDIEGMDLEVLSDLDWNNWRPYIVQTEFSDQFASGTSDRMEQLLHNNGYTVVALTDVNIIAIDTRHLKAQTV